MSIEARIELGPENRHRSPVAAAIWTKARADILDRGYLEESEVVRLMGVEQIGSLILDGEVLSYADHGDNLFPTFQFNPITNRPFEAVKQVNLILDAPNDGWGVTAWWIQPNGSIAEGCAPVELLGTVNEGNAVFTAQLSREDVW